MTNNEKRMRVSGRGGDSLQVDDRRAGVALA